MSEGEWEKEHGVPPTGENAYLLCSVHEGMMREQYICFWTVRSWAFALVSKRWQYVLAAHRDDPIGDLRELFALAKQDRMDRQSDRDAEYKATHADDDGTPKERRQRKLKWLGRGHGFRSRPRRRAAGGA